MLLHYIITITSTGYIVLEGLITQETSTDKIYSSTI